MLTFKVSNYEHLILCGTLLEGGNISDDGRIQRWSLRLWVNQGLYNKFYHLFTMFEDITYPDTVAPH